MARHVCLKEWVNGNEISVSIDDNCCSRFRAEFVVFRDDINIQNRVDVGYCMSPTSMARMLDKSRDIALAERGSVKEFCSRVLVDQESLEE